VPYFVLTLGGHDLLGPHGRVQGLDDIVHDIHLDEIGLRGRPRMVSGDPG